jgi:phosphoglycerate kinase
VVCAHLGRPGGKPDRRYSLAPVAARLGELLGDPVALAADTVGPAARAAVAALPPGRVVMLENLRFCAGETSKDDAERAAFAGQLAALADVYVGDGFGVLHRRHASVHDVVRRLPHAAGYLVAAETAALSRLAADIQRPYAVVLGGAKVADKIGALLDRADQIFVGGAVAFTFLAAQGHPVGASLVERDQLDAVRGYLDRARCQETRVGRARIVLPPDIVAAPARAPGALRKVVPAGQIPTDWMGLDIRPEAAWLFAAQLAGAKTIFWNGPMGVFELEPFAAGTRTVAGALIDSGAFTVIGGGDTAAAVRALGFADSAFGYVSTGGGASLDYLQGKDLPGLDALAGIAVARV